ncbi:ASF1 anti-silencing function 1 [Quaeritorhiza haematococci]|nr:ASF1 anti-silencing function 1 [Quaeritorhiza haematococci]
MSLVNITDVEVLENPATFLSPFSLQITFDVVAPLKNDLDFKLVYVGSAQDSKNDQELESIAVGPVPVGTSKFIFQTPGPKPELIPGEDVIGVTVVLLSCSYMDQEFMRIGYYVNNDYMEEELRENPPAKPVWDKIKRDVLADKPRITRFPISWDTVNEIEAPPMITQEEVEQDMKESGDIDVADEEETAAEEEVAEGEEGGEDMDEAQGDK